MLYCKKRIPRRASKHRAEIFPETFAGRQVYKEMYRWIESVEFSSNGQGAYVHPMRRHENNQQHAYKFAKSKGYTVDPKEIDNKVATGPKRPSKGKTNKPA